MRVRWAISESVRNGIFAHDSVCKQFPDVCVGVFKRWSVAGKIDPIFTRKQPPKAHKIRCHIAAWRAYHARGPGHDVIRRKQNPAGHCETKMIAGMAGGVKRGEASDRVAIFEGHIRLEVGIGTYAISVNLCPGCSPQSG